MSQPALSALIAGVTLLITAVIAILVVFGRSGLRVVPALLHQFVLARLGEANANRLYAAVKIGLRYAASQGLTVGGVTEQAKQVAVEAASRYASHFGLNQLTPDYLRELIDVEVQKQADQVSTAVQLSEAPELATKRDVQALADQVTKGIQRAARR